MNRPRCKSCWIRRGMAAVPRGCHLTFCCLKGHFITWHSFCSRMVDIVVAKTHFTTCKASQRRQNPNQEEGSLWPMTLTCHAKFQRQSRKIIREDSACLVFYFISYLIGPFMYQFIYLLGEEVRRKCFSIQQRTLTDR